ncbi:hypothetical protein [Neobacillus drentensis]|uniref:hypothetical protein n=1 Tax=Neobacillus drentensis TaxID=220684 RepID=UPI000BF76752|nr:hypothetical protein CN481_16065 [Bacillus sp. AFS006103]
MKRTTKRIIEIFPNLEEKISKQENVKLADEVLPSLDPVKRTFLKLACFFEDPEEVNFDLASLYKELDNDWLELAVELITQFFREDTYLIQKPSYSIIKDGSDYLNLSQFAGYLTERGLKYDRQKVNLYYVRGSIPQPDLIVGGTKYWHESTAETYYKQEKSRLN